MGILNANQHNTQQHLRAFYQPGGPGPQQPTLYGGQDGGFIQIEGASQNFLGDVTAQFMPDPNRPGQWVPVAKMTSAPDLPGATVTFSEKKGGIPKSLMGQQCAFSLYESVGECKNPGNFLIGWENYVMVYPNGQGTTVDMGDRTHYDGTDVLKEAIDTTWERNPFPVGPINVGVAALGTLTAVKVEDIIYGNQVLCGGQCGPGNDGTKFMYACVDGAVAGKLNVMYSVDGGVTWTSQLLALSVNAEIPTAIAQVGPYLVVLSKVGGGATQSAYYYTDINQVTGVPTFANWTKVTTGFLNVASRGANDIFVVSPNEVWFPADGGYIYKSTDITQGVTVALAAGISSANLLRMAGVGSTYVAVGASATVAKSANAGRTWAATTTSPTVGGAQAVAVTTPMVFWVGGDTGRLWYTIDGGESWVEKTFLGGGVGQVRDILFTTPEVGYFSHSTAAPLGRVFATWNGGYSWSNTAPRINALPAFANILRLATPDFAGDMVAANNLAMAGTFTDATTGQAAYGTVPQV